MTRRNQACALALAVAMFATIGTTAAHATPVPARAHGSATATFKAQLVPAKSKAARLRSTAAAEDPPPPSGNCVANVGMDWAQVPGTKLFDINFTGGWSCSFTTLMHGQTTLDYGSADSPFAVAPAFDQTAPSFESSSSVAFASPGAYFVEFNGSVAAPEGQEFLEPGPGCTKSENSLILTCSVAAAADLVPA
jgi:hypothetical protein